MRDARISKILELQQLNEDLQAQVAMLRGALEEIVKEYVSKNNVEESAKAMCGIAGAALSRWRRQP
ncbi:hypothetical protein [Anaeromusa sp.]|uniref:hypothetical protein n=1 Tax=Anaeromusa sp. TaxID=1872520 RepID=UPI002629BFEE|nr:hypothetical protein [Anaeromusa sp.]MDD3157454.1 hypothetical protein [Anaeromusa sp.]